MGLLTRTKDRLRINIEVNQGQRKRTAGHHLADNTGGGHLIKVFPSFIRKVYFLINASFPTFPSTKVTDDM